MRICPAADHPVEHPRLDWCMHHGYDPSCVCPAWLVALGCSDETLEARLKAQEEGR